MTDFEVHLSIDGGKQEIGRARCNRARGKEIVVFEYADALPETYGSRQPPSRCDSTKRDTATL